MVATRRPSSILDRHRLQNVGYGLAAIHGSLQQVVDILPLDEVGGSVLLGEKGGEGFSRQLIGFVLQPVDLDPAWLQLAEALEVLERAGKQVSRPGQVLAHLAGGLRD